MTRRGEIPCQVCVNIQEYIMKTILMILHLTNGEIAKVPVTLLSTQTCNDKFVEMLSPKSSDDGVYYNGHQVWASYCKTGDGKLVP